MSIANLYRKEFGVGFLPSKSLLTIPCTLVREVLFITIHQLYKYG
jgi:hypothetical protein